MINKSDLYFCVAKMPQKKLNTNDKLREMRALYYNGLGSLICKEHFQIKKRILTTQTKVTENMHKNVTEQEIWKTAHHLWIKVTQN